MFHHQTISPFWNDRVLSCSWIFGASTFFLYLHTIEMTSRPRSLFEPSPAHPYIPPSLTSPSLHSAPLRIPVRKAKCDSGSGVDLDFDETEILEDSSSSIYSTPSKSHESPIPPGDFRCHTLRRQVAFSKLSDLVSKFNSCGTGDSTDIVDSRSSHSLRRKEGKGVLRSIDPHCRGYRFKESISSPSLWHKENTMGTSSEGSPQAPKSSFASRRSTLPSSTGTRYGTGQDLVLEHTGASCSNDGSTECERPSPSFGSDLCNQKTETDGPSSVVAIASPISKRPG